jgi:glutamate--cysteine ligase catalytic subunit
MGLLVVGKPLTWSESEPYRAKVLDAGVEQLIHIYRRVKDRKGDCLKWGDEVPWH